MKRRRRPVRRKPTSIIGRMFQSPSLNATIIFLAFIVIAFVASFFQNSWQGDEKISMAEPSLSVKAKIFTDFDGSPMTLIKVEVLNGCGENGLGGQFTDFLRNYHVDVTSTEDADHFDFNATQIIQRSEFLDRGYQLASLLGIDEDDIIDGFDLDLDWDVTVVIGSDFRAIEPFDNYLESRRLN